MNIRITEQNDIVSKDNNDTEMTQAQLCYNLGISEKVPAYTVLDQLFGDIVEIIPENEEKINVFLNLVIAHQPKSLLEAQLIVQMLICHKLNSRMLKKFSQETFPEIQEKYLNMAMKLTRNFNSAIETLGKYRRGGKQHISIEHISVEKDAQAMIGNINGGKS